MNTRSDEPELRGLMLAGLDGDSAAHKALLTRLSANLRAYFKTELDLEKFMAQLAPKA